MIWIDQQEILDRAIDSVVSQTVVAVDTEADSLHSYFDKVCLIQVSAASDDLVIDPLAGVDLKRFGEVLAESSITKVLHGADYDLRILNRDFGFTTSNLIDTMVSAQLLGYEAYGLGALLERHFGVTVNKAHQRADWAMRPLTPEMLEYATMDTRYLVALAEKLREELNALGRWEWAQEEFARLEAIRYREVPDDEEGWRKMKNLGNLDRRGHGVIRELYLWRDHLARTADRPPFKIIGNDALLEIAKEKPQTIGDLGKLKSVSQYHRSRYARQLVEIVKRVVAMPESELPERNEPKTWIRDKALEDRINRLKRVRDKIAAELKLDPGLLAPRHVLTAVASSGSLDDIPAMRNWQRTVVGDSLMQALKRD
ncbi:MAG TPA: ribonuclease D [Thermoanaerobaculia bacterium]|nr:ribonuclease D [Thermoanaerobaculia bacterium]